MTTNMDSYVKAVDTLVETSNPLREADFSDTHDAAEMEKFLHKLGKKYLSVEPGAQQGLNTFWKDLIADTKKNGGPGSLLAGLAAAAFVAYQLSQEPGGKEWVEDELDD